MVPEGDCRHCTFGRFAHQCSFVLYSHAQHLFVVAEEYDQIGKSFAHRLWTESGGISISVTDHSSQCRGIGPFGGYCALCTYALPGFGGTNVPFAQCRFLVVDARGGNLVVPVGILL